MNRETVREALRLMESRRPFVRATVVRSEGSVPGKPGASMLVRFDGSTFGTVGGAALEEEVKALAREALRTRQGGLHHFDLQRWREGGLPSLCGGSLDLALEYVPAVPHLLLWGGGHVAHAIAQLLPTLEYDYSVADDRPEWVGEDRFPRALRRVVVDAGSIWERMTAEEYTHLYVLGYDAARDLEVLRVSAARFPGAIGLIASETKRLHLFAELRRRGVSEAEIARIRSPIGLAIGAQSPAEIAVSVIAELVQEAHGDRDRPAAAGASEAAEGHDVGTA